VHYAIADVPAFVDPGGPVDLEANRRGETLYGADSKVPLHPKVLSEDAASLLPGEVRPAFVWTLALARDGSVDEARVERALVRSREQLDYESLQRRGKDDDLFALLQEIGELRVALEVERGGVNLPMPAQEVVIEGDRWSLEFREMMPVEAVRRLRRQAQALKIRWPAEEGYPDFIRRLDPSAPAQAAMVVACTTLLRGAGYVGFAGRLPEQREHAALASAYAHCTAPLRRLVDRYALEICASLCAGQEVPDWVLERLDQLPETMRESGRRANTYENAVVDLVEASMLRGRVGEEFSAVVLEVDDKTGEDRADIQIEEPAIEARATGKDLPLGERVTATLVEADPATRTVRFQA
jgi:exoribonuclease R